MQLMRLISKNFKKSKGDFENFTKTNFQIFGDLNFEVSFDLKKFLFFDKNVLE